MLSPNHQTQISLGHNITWIHRSEESLVTYVSISNPHMFEVKMRGVDEKSSNPSTLLDTSEWHICFTHVDDANCVLQNRDPARAFS